MEKLAGGFGLVEGPVWDPARGLLFTDVTGGGVHLLGNDGDTSCVVPHRRGIGGLALHAGGGLVVSGRNVALKLPAGGATDVLLEAAGEEVGFNDLTTDAAGRVWVGALAHRPLVDGDSPKPADLYCVDLDGVARAVGHGIGLSNGLGFSPDGRRLYHSDSAAGVVRRYAVHGDATLGEPEPFARIDDGIPDGLAVDEEGGVWVAVAHGSRVEAFAPDGRRTARLACDLPMVTSVCFGGAGLRDLYVVTGSRGAPSPRAGSVFRVTLDVAGLPVPPARVAPRPGGGA